MSFYAVANAVRAETRNSTEKLVLVLISSFANDETGLAWPSVNYLAEHCMCSPRTVRRCLLNLVEDGWLAISPTEGKRNTYLVADALSARPHGMKVGISAPGKMDVFITPANMSPLSPMANTPAKESDTSQKKCTSSPLISKEPISKDNTRFRKPLITEITAYMFTRGYGEIAQCEEEAESFFDHHESRGWKMGKAKIPMKDWTAAVRTWLKNQEKWNAESKSTGKQNRGPTSIELANNIEF